MSKEPCHLTHGCDTSQYTHILCHADQVAHRLLLATSCEQTPKSFTQELRGFLPGANALHCHDLERSRLGVDSGNKIGIVRLELFRVSSLAREQRTERMLSTKMATGCLFSHYAWAHISETPSARFVHGTNSTLPVRVACS